MSKSTFAAIAAFLMILMIALACGGEAGNTPAGNDSNTTTKASPEESAAAPEAESFPDETEAAPEEEEAPEPEPEGPERVRFKKGMSEGTITVPLPANEKKRYVIGVAAGQHLSIAVEDFRPLINVLSRSKLTDIEDNKEENKFYALTTKGGDIIFEIENPTRNSIKTTATISIYDKVY